MEEIFVLQLPKPDTKGIAVYYPQLPATDRIVQLPISSAGIEDIDLTTDIGRARRAIVKALTEYYYLTAEQLTRLLFRPASYSYVNNTHMKFLLENELVERILPAKQTLYGRAPYVYTLSRKGWHLAKDLGFSVGPRYRAIAESTHKPYTLAHVLAVNEFLIKTHLLAKHNTEIVIRKTLHDKVLSQRPLKSQLPGEEKAKNLIPDSWVDLGQKSLRLRYCNCVEVNLTEINQNRWRETVRKYLYCLPAYKEQFGTDILTVLVSVQTATDFPVRSLDRLTADELKERKAEERNRTHRRQNLIAWTEKELTMHGRYNDADMFRFSSAPLDQITYEELYFAPHWYSPFQDTPHPLILERKEDSGA